MLSLFDDTKNPLFRLLCQIVNEVADGAKCTRKEILNRIYSLPEFNYLEAPETEREENIVDTLFRFNCGGFAEIPLKKKFSLPMSDTELCWLSAILSNGELFFLLPDELREKLSARLKNFPPLYEKNSWRKLQTAEEENTSGEIFYDKLSVAIAALILQKKLIDGDKFLTPCRLEYDLFADKYFLIVWREEMQTVEKISFENLNGLILSEENIALEVEEVLQNFYAKNNREVSLRIRNTRNAVERCFALFSSFDKKSRLQDDGTYFLTIRYCVLDEEEIFEKILSLGATATVISPQDFRNRIIKKFLDIKALYK